MTGTAVDTVLKAGICRDESVIADQPETARFTVAVLAIQKAAVLFFAFTAFRRRLQVAERVPCAFWKQVSRHSYTHVVLQYIFARTSADEADSSL